MRAMKAMNLKWEQMANVPIEGQILGYEEYNVAAVVNVRTHDKESHVAETKEIATKEVKIQTVEEN